jgi:transposase
VRQASGEINIAAHKVFSNNPKGLKELKKWEQKLNPEKVPVQFVMEATGVYHENAALFLYTNGYDVKLVLPNKAMHFQRTLEIKTVTDKTSANALAQMGLEKKLDNWEPPHPVFNKLRQLCRERNQLIDEQTMIKNQIEAEESGAWENSASVQRMKKRLSLVAKQKKETVTDMQQVVKAEPWLQEKLNYICSIPGVGFVTAITVMGETNGFNLTRNKRQLVSYAGLDVVVKDSGTSVKSKPRISHRGNGHLRKALYFPALAAIRKNEHMKNLFKRLVQKHGIKMKAAVAVQRKTLELIYILWKKEEMFDAEKYQSHIKEIESHKGTLSELAQ